MQKGKRKVIFLDRDGVINRDPAYTEHGYVTRWRQFRFLPGAKRAIRELTEAGYSIYVISNQAGIAKGYFTSKELREVTRKMLMQIRGAGGSIAGVFYCPHKAEDNCGCRKPKTGLFERAVGGDKEKIKGAFFIGDKIMDVQAGRATGCRTILVLCGKTKLQTKSRWEEKPDYIKKDLLDAVRWILR